MKNDCKKIYDEIVDILKRCRSNSKCIEFRKREIKKILDLYSEYVRVCDLPLDESRSWLSSIRIIGIEEQIWDDHAILKTTLTRIESIECPICGLPIEIKIDENNDDYIYRCENLRCPLKWHESCINVTKIKKCKCGNLITTKIKRSNSK